MVDKNLFRIHECSVERNSKSSKIQLFMDFFHSTYQTYSKENAGWEGKMSNHIATAHVIGLHL